MPERIQRRRTRGWRMPEGAVYVGRGSRWGNPYRIGDPHPQLGESGRPMSAADVVDLYELHSGPMGNHELNVDEARELLAGRDLACWCRSDSPCHADVLLQVANDEVAS